MNLGGKLDVNLGGKTHNLVTLLLLLLLLPTTTTTTTNNNNNNNHHHHHHHHHNTRINNHNTNNTNKTNIGVGVVSSFINVLTVMFLALFPVLSELTA